MGKANVSRQALVEAIATLEVQRVLTSNDRDLNQAVDTVLIALRDKLAQMQAEPGDQKRHQLAVLVADLSGFTAFSERMDVERVRDAINAMWDVLDAVIQAWGGQIDQHAGDSLMALFGLPIPRQGDAGRALNAALAMQQELHLFNQRARRAAADPLDASWEGEWPGPSMRIGVHSGPVYFAHVPGGGRATAVGDTVVEARRLEKLAPAGRVLVSAATRRQALNRFNFTHAPEFAPTATDEEPYLIASERPLSAGYIPGTVAGKASRLVGRTELMDRLHVALQATADSQSPHMVTIVGAPGAGKSRLVYEFEKQAALLGGSPTILRAGTEGALPDFPYALIRDMLLRRFSIRPQDSRYLVEQKLREGVAGLTAIDGGREPDEADGQHIADFGRTLSILEQLLDSRAAGTLPVAEVLTIVEPLLSAITADGAAIAILEGINRADRQSLELVDRLVNEGHGGSLLFLGLATVADATDPAMMLPWYGREDALFSPIERLDVNPLSPVDSRLMATEILGPLSPPPLRLLDLVVAESGGNPLYIESFIRLLIEQGTILTGERWRVNMDQIERISLPSGLPRLIDAQLTYLTGTERKVMQFASVFGPLCWDTALLELIPTDEASRADIEAAILSLELKGYLASDDLYSITSSQAYAFRRDSVREAAYAAIPAGNRQVMHIKAANWLIANQDNARLSAWLPIDAMIARHFAAAGDGARAHAWRQRSGMPISE